MHISKNLIICILTNQRNKIREEDFVSKADGMFFRIADEKNINRKE
jgi:hypothetical protein